MKLNTLIFAFIIMASMLGINLVEAFAQTTVCSGDSVVLVLTTRTAGSTLWQQSSDQTTWSTAPGTSYNDSLITIPTDTFYYRAQVTDGTCNPYYSDTVLVIVNDCIHCTYKSTCNGNITDARDSKTYKTIQIGTQCWMAQNLNVGTMIQVASPQTNNGIIEKYCYEDNPNNCNTYGGFYMWDEMMAYGASVAGDGKGPQGICPAGWHLPTDNEWMCLQETLGGALIAGGKLKDTTLWKNPNTGATNKSGFSALPSGARQNIGLFGNQGFYAYFWTATEGTSARAWYRGLGYNVEWVARGSYDKTPSSFSVRCVKD